MIARLVRGLPLPWLIVSRIIGFPIVAGLAYEVIRWAGRNRRKRWVRGLMWPGLQLQRLTTQEPSLDQPVMLVMEHGVNRCQTDVLVAAAITSNEVLVEQFIIIGSRSLAVQ